MKFQMLDTTYITEEGIAVECNDANYFGSLLTVLGNSESIADFHCRMCEDRNAHIPYTLYKVEKWKECNQ